LKAVLPSIWTSPGQDASAQPAEVATKAAAEIVADEFAAQEKVIDPGKMPATRLVNTAIDGIAQDPQAVFEDILRFAGTDMLCYRADSPQELVSRQTQQWDPLIDWMEGLGARFSLAEGVTHIEHRVKPSQPLVSIYLLSKIQLRWRHCIQ
jgi:chaperone required for assembly of F1-ATPase